MASPTTSLPESPGADRQFDHRYTWLHHRLGPGAVDRLARSRRAAPKEQKDVKTAIGAARAKQVRAEMT